MPVTKDVTFSVTRKRTAAEITTTIQRRKLTQTQAAGIVRDHASQISLITNGHLRGFSFERLLVLLSRLGNNIVILSEPTKNDKPGKITFSRTQPG